MREHIPDWAYAEAKKYADHTFLNKHVYAIARAIAEERDRCAKLCDALGAVEQADFGLTRAAQNYFRARNSISAGEDPEMHYKHARGDK